MFLLKKHLILVQKIGYGFRGYPSPPIYGFFWQKGGYGFGGYPPPFTDKIRKVVFEVAPQLLHVFHIIICITPILDGAHCQGRMRWWIYIDSQSDCLCLTFPPSLPYPFILPQHHFVILFNIYLSEFCACDCVV